MPDLATVIARARTEYDVLVSQFGRPMQYQPAGGAPGFEFRAAQRGVKPEEYEAGDIVQHTMVITCRDNEFTAAGVTPEPGDSVVVDGRDCHVEGMAPKFVGEVLVGYRIFASG